MRLKHLVSLLFVVGLLAGLHRVAWAVPYAANVRNTTGSTWEFVLNEAASGVSITRDGGNVLNLGALAAGRHTFDLSTFSTFDIEVSNSAASGWTWTNNTAGLYDDFERPTGLAVNNMPANLAYFGTVYVNNSSLLTTATGRTMGDAVYAMTADLIGVDAATFGTVADTAIPATPPGWNVAGSNNSAWRMSLDDSGNVLISDWSDANGGIKWASRDLTTGGPLLNQQSGPTFGVTNGFGDYIHGSIVSKPYSTGTVGVDLTLYGMDEDMEAIPFVSADGNNVWRWNVGAATDYSGTGVDEADDLVPDLIIDPGSLVAGAGLSPNVGAGSATDSDADPWFLNLNVGAIAETHFNEQHDKWYLLSPRDNGHDSSSIIVTDASDPQTVLWSSKQFSLDNGLDGFIAIDADYNDDGTTNAADYVVWRKDPSAFGGQLGYDRWRANFGDAPGACDPALCGGINDIFREAWAVDFSNDGTEMYVLMSFQYTSVNNTNPVIGPASPNGLDGKVLVIPLDANGLPDIQVNDNGTPGDPSDDYLDNVTSIPVGTLQAGTIRVNLDVDAAGNVYVTSNISELLEVWSPGGNTMATTSWNGTTGSFSVTGPGSGAGAGAVPEPGTVVLAVAGLLMAGACRRRRQGSRA